jgi:NAD(P)-dependent dehydrogenase (short-subunit alcohol dehydrogenase family)
VLLGGKVVIVSGIGPGLGQSLALVAAQEGARLSIAARTPAKLDAAEAAMREQGLDAEVLKVPTDIRDRSQCKRLVDETMARFGQIDVLINSAYVSGAYVPAAEADLNDWRETMEVNLFGSMNLIQETVPHMKAQGGGSIVNVNSKVVRMPYPGMGGYAASKSALKTATSQLAKELGPFRIRLNSAFPGWMWGATVETNMKARAKAQGRTVAELRAEVAANLPLGDIPDDYDCARAIVALSSDYFLPVTGACLDISAGEYLPP